MVPMHAQKAKEGSFHEPAGFPPGFGVRRSSATFALASRRFAAIPSGQPPPLTAQEGKRRSGGALHNLPMNRASSPILPPSGGEVSEGRVMGDVCKKNECTFIFLVFSKSRLSLGRSPPLMFRARPFSHTPTAAPIWCFSEKPANPPTPGCSVARPVLAASRTLCP